MRVGADENQYEAIVEYLIYEQPVGLDVALAETLPVMMKRMIAVLWRKSFAMRELQNDIVQKRNIQVSLHGEFVISLELSGRLDRYSFIS